MDHQTVINIAIGLIGALGGWILTIVWGAVKDLQNADRELAEKVSNIEVLVAGKYVTREEFITTVNSVFAKLDRIQDLIMQKADR